MKIMGVLKQHVLAHEILKELIRQTNFDGIEIQRAYERFMADSPHGKIGFNRFKLIYCDIFPNGNADLFAETIFKCFDENKDDWIQFNEFLCAMSVLGRGSLVQKLRWIFNVYDRDQNGVITKDELAIIIKSLYKMYGTEMMHGDFKKMSLKDLTKNIFEQMDYNGDGKVTFDEFAKASQSYDSIKRILDLDPHSYM